MIAMSVINLSIVTRSLLIAKREHLWARPFYQTLNLMNDVKMFPSCLFYMANI